MVNTCNTYGRNEVNTCIKACQPGGKCMEFVNEKEKENAWPTHVEEEKNS